MKSPWPQFHLKIRCLIAGRLYFWWIGGLHTDHNTNIHTFIYIHHGTPDSPQYTVYTISITVCLLSPFFICPFVFHLSSLTKAGFLESIKLVRSDGQGGLGEGHIHYHLHLCTRKFAPSARLNSIYKKNGLLPDLGTNHWYVCREQGENRRKNILFWL